ncbi:hypothetical protein [Pontixanthobacter sp. CEM42]|uniref:hypothetical protein n=1 Tax=Pontixanthobacter sp. CEM42 TaxID=2792077 RepID=UPI001ADF7004|nr:hypothetical protein [Pontixanthobacter sp. CEM42]
MKHFYRKPLSRSALLGAAALLIGAPSMTQPSLAASGPFDQIKERLPKVPKVSAPSSTTTSQRSAPTSRPSNTRADREAAKPVDETLTEILSFMLDISALIRAEDGAWDEAKQDVSAYRTRMDTLVTPDLIARANNLSTRPTQRLLKKAEDRATSMAARISEVNVDRTLAASRPATMFSRYGVPLSHREKLLQLQRLYPESTAIREANQTATGVLAQLGTFDQVEQQAEANLAAKIAATRMYPAVRRSAAQERDFTRAFWGSPWQKKYRGSKTLKINLTSRSWSVQHHPVSGRPVTRDQGASLAFQTPDGKCYMDQGLYEQKYAGGGWGGTYYRSGDTSEMLCENVPR